MDAELVAALSGANHLPKVALRQAVERPEAIAEPVLRLLGAAADDPDPLSDDDLNLAFWGLHALAAARDPRLFPVLLRVLRLDDPGLETLLGDALTETIPLVLASAYAGDFEGLSDLILSSTVEAFVCDGAFQAMAFLTREGRIPLEAATGLLVRFDDARVAVEGSPAWVGWEETIAYLGLAALVPRVEAARRDGRITDEFSDFAWFRRALRQVTAEPSDYSAFDSRYGYLDDPVAVLGWTAENAGKPVKNPMKSVGRNDPCPCGSGKKFKKCCLNLADVPVAPPVRLPGLS